jgi:hypothetical protein
MKQQAFFDISNKIYTSFVAGELNKGEFTFALFLLLQWNAKRRPSKFNLATNNLISILKITKRDFYKYRNSLKQKRIIDFVPGNRRIQNATYYWVSNDTLDDTQSDTQSDTQNGTQSESKTPINTTKNEPLEREEKRRDKNIRAEDKVSKKQDVLVPPKEAPISKKYDPDEDVPSEVYKFITDNFGKQAIGIFKRNKVPLMFVHWIIRVKKKPLNGVRKPIFYICALAKDPTLFGDFNAWQGEQDKQALKGEISWMKLEG